MTPLELAERTVEVLNRAFEADPVAVDALVNLSVTCNQKLGDDPAIQVGLVPYTEFCEVGLVGLLNGVVGYDAEGSAQVRIGRVLDDDGRLTGFSLLVASSAPGAFRSSVASGVQVDRRNKELSE